MSETPIEEPTGRVYAESDYTKVVDKVTGEELPDPIPKAWVGTDLAPGVKAKAGKVTFPDGDEVADGEETPTATSPAAATKTTTSRTSR